MKKRLYSVRVERSIYVLAESLAEAERIGEQRLNAMRHKARACVWPDEMLDEDDEDNPLYETPEGPVPHNIGWYMDQLEWDE